MSHNATRHRQYDQHGIHLAFGRVQRDLGNKPRNAQQTDGELMRISLDPACIFSIQTGKLGELAVFPLNFGDFCDLADECGNSFDRVTPIEFCKKFMLKASCPKGRVVNNRRPKDFKFPGEFETDISDEEVESFSERYIKHELSNDESKLQYYKSSEATGQDESNCERLRKAKSNEYSKLIESISRDDLTRAIKTAEGMLGFSEATRSMMEYTSSIEDSLRQMHRDYEAPKISEPLVNIQDISRRQREFYEEPFKPIYEKLEKLNSINSETVKYISELNKTQTAIASELKQSSDQTSTISKKNYRMSVWVLLASLLSVGVAIVALYFTITGTSDIDTIASKNTTAIQEKFNQLIDNETRLNEQLKNLTNIMSKQQKLPQSEQPKVIPR